MKKEFILAVFLVALVVVAGCAVKPYSATDQNQKEIDLVKELQDIEKQLDEAEEGSADVENASDAVDEVAEEEAVSDTVVVTNESSDVVDEAEETTVPSGGDTSSLQKIEVQETELVNLKVETEDADKDAVVYTFSAPVGTNGTWQTNYGDAGEYVVTVTASDGENTVEQKVLLVVKKKNVPPTIKDVPEKLEVNEGETITLEPKVSDPNKDSVTVSYSAPLGQDGSWITDHKSAGEYETTVTATDGEAETKAKLMIVVKDVNVPPTIAGLEDALSIKEGEKVTLKPDVSDLDGDKIEVSISEPVGDDGMWETGYTDHGEYVVTVTASDGKDTVSKEVKLTVEDVNLPPKIIVIKQG